MAEQIFQVKQIREKYLSRLAQNVDYYIPIAADVTQSSAEIIDTYVSRGLEVEVPVYYTGGKDSYWKDGLFHIGKSVLVSASQETFQLDFIRINSALDVPEGLVEEIKNFGAKRTTAGRNRFEALSGKDDQVNAMMLAIYTMYVLMETKDKIMEWDVNGHNIGRFLSYDEWLKQERESAAVETDQPSYNIFW